LLAAPLGEVPRSSIVADGDSGGGPETPKSGLEMVPVLTEVTHPVRRQMGKRAGLHAIPLEVRQQVDRDVALAREQRKVERMRKEAELLEWGRRFVEDHQMVGTEKVTPLVEGDQMLIEDAAEDTDLESEPELEVVQEQAAWVDEMVIDSVIVGHAPYGDEERTEMMTFKPSRADRDWVSLLIDRCCDVSDMLGDNLPIRNSSMELMIGQWWDEALEWTLIMVRARRYRLVPGRVLATWRGTSREIGGETFWQVLLVFEYVLGLVDALNEYVEDWCECF